MCINYNNCDLICITTCLIIPRFHSEDICEVTFPARVAALHQRELRTLLCAGRRAGNVCRHMLLTSDF